MLLQQWTDERLPLTLSVPARIERVMVGRIELIADWQTHLIDQIADNPVPSRNWFKTIPKSDARNAFFAGRSDFGDLGVKIPAEFQACLDLGRFRNSLIRAEAKNRPKSSLSQFIKQYRLATPQLVPAKKPDPRRVNGRQIVLLRSESSPADKIHADHLILSFFRTEWRDSF